MKHYIKIDLTNMKHDIKVLFELVYLNSEIKKKGFQVMMLNLLFSPTFL